MYQASSKGFSLDYNERGITFSLFDIIAKKMPGCKYDADAAEIKSDYLFKPLNS